MKFVCRQCEAFMLFRETEPVQEESLGITFECPGCRSRISMVTNPGESQIVRAFGVKLGGRDRRPEPLELTRQTLASPASSPQPVGPVRSVEPAPEARRASPGRCPFASAAADMREKPSSTQQESLLWTPEARERLERVPDPARPFAKAAIETLARQEGRDWVDAALMDRAKDKFMKP